MSSVQKIAKNTAFLFVGDLTFRLISLFVTIYLARYLGVENFGIYNFVFAFLTYFSILKNLGLHDILAREISKDLAIAPKMIGNAYIIKFILTIFAIILCTITITLSSYSSEITNYVYVVSIMILFTSFSDFYTVIYQVNYKMKYKVFANLTFKIVSASLIFLVIHLNGALMQIFMVIVFSEMIRTGVSYIFSKKLITPQFDMDYKLWKYLIYESTPIALTSVIYVIYFRTDVIMLSVMIGNAAVGIYSAANNLVEPLSLITASLVVPLFPLMASSFKNSQDKLIKSYTLSMKYLFLILIPMTTGITLMADKAIVLIYGEPFINSVGVLQILIWTLALSGNLVFINLLIAINKQKYVAKSMTIAAIFNVSMNYVLIPLFSYNGASIATILSSSIVFIMNYHYIGKHFMKLPLHKLIIKPTLGSLLMAIYLHYFTDNVFLMIIGGSLIYFAALIILKTFNNEDRDIFREVIRQK